MSLTQGVFEAVFAAAYLIAVLSMGMVMLLRSYGDRQTRLFGVMALVLGCGDAFHLLPRAYALLTDGLAMHTAALGYGKLVTSITMTVFYLILYKVWRQRYRVRGHKKLTRLMWMLALARIALCFFPQNGWTSDSPSLWWAAARNLPFVLMGILVVVLFYQSASWRGDRSFGMLWIAVSFSFLCYLPVVFFAQAVPSVGMLMIPKTLAYVWIIHIGYRELRWL